MNTFKRSVLFAIVGLIVSARFAAGQGTLQVEGKDYKLEHLVAYQTKFFDNDAAVVLLSSKPIPMDKLKTALKAGNDDDFTFFEPQVKLTFEPTGKLISVFVWADKNSINYSGTVDGSKVDASFANGKAHGKVTVAKEKCKFDVAFDAPIMK